MWTFCVSSQWASRIRNQLSELSVFSVAFQPPSAGKGLDGEKAKAESHCKWGARLPNVSWAHVPWTWAWLQRRRAHNGNSDGCMLRQPRERKAHWNPQCLHGERPGGPLGGETNLTTAHSQHLSSVRQQDLYVQSLRKSLRNYTMGNPSFAQQ